MRQPDRSAERAAVLVAPQRVARKAVNLIEEGVRIQVTVPQVIERRAVPCVATRLGDLADDPASVAAVLSGIVTLQNAKLLDRIRIRIEDHAVVEQVVVETSVKQEGYRVG